MGSLPLVPSVKPFYALSGDFSNSWGRTVHTGLPGPDEFLVLAFDLAPVLATVFTTMAWSLFDHRLRFSGLPSTGQCFFQLCPQTLLESAFPGHICFAFSAGLCHTPERNLMTLLLFISKKELITSHLSLHCFLGGSHRLVKSDMSYFSNMPSSSLKASFSGILCSDLSPAPLLTSLVSAEVSLSQRSTHRPRVPNSKSQLLPPPLHCASLFL